MILAYLLRHLLSSGPSCSGAWPGVRHLLREVDSSFESCFHDLLHGFAQSRQVPEQLPESLARNSDCIHRCRGAYGRVARKIRNQRGFAEYVPVTQSRKGGAVPLDRYFTFDQEVDFIAKIIGAEHGFAWLEMFPMHVFFLKESQLGDVAWQKSIQEPVGDQPSSPGNLVT
jgi:hypothetical protein